MAVNTAFLYKPILNWKGRDMPEGNKLEFEFMLEGDADGDASGGDLTLYYDLGDQNKKVYYCITDIFVNAVTTAEEFRFQILNDEWENFFLITADLPVILCASETIGAGAGYGTSDLLNSKMLYLGRPREQGTANGRVNVIFPNTDGTDYHATIFGFALVNPLPFYGVYRNRLY